MKPSYGLTDEEVERMLIDSFEHAEADFAARLLIEARNEAETVITPRERARCDRARQLVGAEERASDRRRRGGAASGARGRRTATRSGSGRPT